MLGLFAATVPAQVRTVTNADLEKFRQKRLQAEQEYRDNYERWGFPSPEELDRQREQDRVDNEALAEKLRENRLEREKLALDRARLANESRGMYYDPGMAGYAPYAGGIGFSYGGGFGDGFRGRRRGGSFGSFGQSGYYAGGQFWPRPLPQPNIRFNNRGRSRIIFGTGGVRGRIGSGHRLSRPR